MFRRIRALVVSLLLIAAAVYLASAPTTPAPRYRLPDEVGFLEHRGKRYFLNDLFDPAYRAASDDPFVKQFDEAEKLAGIYPDSDRSLGAILTTADRRQARPNIWAGDGPEGD